MNKNTCYTIATVFGIIALCIMFFTPVVTNTVVVCFFGSIILAIVFTQVGDTYKRLEQKRKWVDTEIEKMKLNCKEYDYKSFIERILDDTWDHPY